VADVFGLESAAVERAAKVTVLYAKIDELTLANDFLTGTLGKVGLLPSAKRCSTAIMRRRGPYLRPT
jgi:transposase